MDSTQDFSTEAATPVVSAPTAPVILLPPSSDGVNVVKKGSGGPKIKWGKGAKAMLAGSILAVVLLVGGIFAATKLTKKPTNPPSKAWTGATSNPEAVKEISDSQPAVPNLPSQTESASSKAYRMLVLTYPFAEVQNINIPSLNITGNAFLFYDASTNKTYVFARLENLPVLPSRIVRLWLSNIGKDYIPVGVGEFTKEKEKPVLYSVFVKTGNLKKTYKELVISYDISVQANAPLTPFLNLKF